MGGVDIMKVMISQPMRGKTEEQIRTEREELVKDLEELGYEVENTVFTEEYLTKGRPEYCNAGLWALSKSLEKLSQIDALICMKGWKEARGCRIEEQCAREYGKFILYL